MRADQPSLAVIVPVFNEAECLTSFHSSLTDTLAGLEHDWRVLYVDDGSTDDSCQLIDTFRASSHRVELIRLARNFGKEAALVAGLDHCDADLVVTMDADGQHPPELLPEMLGKCDGGADVVFAVRANRADQGAIKRWGARGFYGLMDRLSRVDTLADASDYRLVRRHVVNAYRRLREAHRFNRALFAWLGFTQASVSYQPPPRPAGASKWGVLKLFTYGVDGLISFSILPLRLALIVGALVALGSFIYGLYIFLKTLLFGDPVAGFPTMMILILFLAGLQLLALGVIGEYVGRTFQEAKKRPLYVIRSSSLKQDYSGD